MNIIKVGNTIPLVNGNAILGEDLDEYGLPPKDTGYDWETNNALYLVFDNKMQPSSLLSSKYSTGALVGTNVAATVGYMEGSVYVPDKTLTLEYNQEYGGIAYIGYLSEYANHRWVVVRVTGTITRFYLPCASETQSGMSLVYVYGKMPSITDFPTNGQSWNSNLLNLRKLDISGTIAQSSFSGRLQNFKQLRYLKLATSVEVTNLQGAFNIVLSYLDFSPLSVNISGDMQEFMSNSCLTDIDFHSWNVTATNCTNLFRANRYMTSLNLGTNWIINNNGNYMFRQNPLLTDFVSPIFNVSVYLADSPLLTHDSLMSVINNLGTVSTTQTLTLGSTNLAKLTSEEIAIATNKGWTVA